MTISPAIPKRGEVWLVNFDPTIGAEIKKKRPAVVVSSDAVGVLPIKLIAPVTDWKDRYNNNIWHVKIQPDNTNGLTKASAIDTLQVRGVDLQRFIRKLGRLPSSTMEEISAAIAAIIEYSLFVFFFVHNLLAFLSLNSGRLAEHCRSSHPLQGAGQAWRSEVPNPVRDCPLSRRLSGLKRYAKTKACPERSNMLEANPCLCRNVPCEVKGS